MSKKNLNAQEMAESATAMSKDVDVLDYLTKMIQTVSVDLKRQTNKEIVDILKSFLDIDANAGFLILNHNIYAVCSDGLVAIKYKNILW